MPFDFSQTPDDEPEDEFGDKHGALAVLLFFICSAEAVGAAHGDMSATRALGALAQVMDTSADELRAFMREGGEDGCCA